MNNGKVLATEKIDRNEYRLIALPLLCFIYLVVFYLSISWGIAYNNLFNLNHWLIWGPLLIIMALLFISLYTSAIFPLSVFENGIQIHVIHIYPFAKKFINFSEIEKVVAAEGPLGGYGFYIFLKNGKKYNKALYMKMKKKKLLEDNEEIIKVIESKTKDRFKWITNEEWVQSKF